MSTVYKGDANSFGDMTLPVDGEYATAASTDNPDKVAADRTANLLARLAAYALINAELVRSGMLGLPLQNVAFHPAPGGNVTPTAGDIWLAICQIDGVPTAAGTYSLDGGNSWRFTRFAANAEFRDVAAGNFTIAGNTSGLFVAVGDDGAGTGIAKFFSAASPASAGWSATLGLTGATQLNSIDYSAGDDLWVTVGDGGKIYSGQLSNPITGAFWTPRTADASYTDNFLQVRYLHGRWRAVGQNGEIQDSADGTSWVSRVQFGSSHDLHCIGWIDDHGLLGGSDGQLIAAGQGTTVYLSNTDGASWTTASIPSLGTGGRVRQIITLGRTLALLADTPEGTASQLLLSYDFGQTFTAVRFPGSSAAVLLGASKPNTLLSSAFAERVMMVGNDGATMRTPAFI